LLVNKTQGKVRLQSRPRRTQIRLWPWPGQRDDQSGGDDNGGDAGY
jgi:hypothetical protein